MVVSILQKPADFVRSVGSRCSPFVSLDNSYSAGKDEAASDRLMLARYSSYVLELS